MEVTRYDAVPLKATKTPEGYIVDSPVLGRVGVQIYRDAKGKEFREYRPPSAVFDPEHLAAIRGRPIIDGHISRVDSANVRAHTIGTVLSEGRQDGDNLRADIIIHDPSAILKGGRRELSLGYRVVVNETPGVTPEGERYDTIVERIAMVDHLAVVAKGRAGVARLNLDAADATSLTTDEADMPDMTKVRLDSGLSYEAAPEVAQALTAAQEAAKNAGLRADKAEAALDAAKTKLADAEKAIEQVRKDAAGTVRARLELESVAAKHGVEVKPEATDRSIREAVITKLRGDSGRMDGKSDDYVGFAFDHAVSDAAKRSDASAVQRSVVNGVPAPRADAAPAIRSARAARDAMIRRG